MGSSSSTAASGRPCWSSGQRLGHVAVAIADGLRLDVGAVGRDPAASRAQLNAPIWTAAARRGPWPTSRPDRRARSASMASWPSSAVAQQLEPVLDPPGDDQRPPERGDRPAPCRSGRRACWNAARLARPPRPPRAARPDHRRTAATSSSIIPSPQRSPRVAGLDEDLLAELARPRPGWPWWKRTKASRPSAQLSRRCRPAPEGGRRLVEPRLGLVDAARRRRRSRPGSAAPTPRRGGPDLAERLERVA